MASRKFRFVSPGVFLKEVDNSELPGQAPGIGPVLIGRTRRGPALKPYKIRSLEEFERVFGKAMPGNEGLDPWRQGTDLLAESYLPYAARAYLSADISSPVTVVRLAGVAGEDGESGTDGEPGWKADNAWGLFMFPSASAGLNTSPKLELAAIFYGAPSKEFSIGLKGASFSGSTVQQVPTGHAVKFNGENRLSLVLSASSGRSREVSFISEEIRKDFNTNPVATNSEIMSPAASTLADSYWLGESFDESIRKFESSIPTNGARAAVVLKLDDEMAEFRSKKHDLTPARTGWVVSNDTRMDNSNFSVADQTKLFRLLARQEGAQANHEFIVGIEDIVIPREGELGDNQYGKFSVVVKMIDQSEGLKEVERFDNCNLKPSSDNYVARKVGDQYYKWDSTEKRNKLYGTHPGFSEFIRVEMDPAIDGVSSGPDNKGSVPFGFLGPVVPKTIATGSSTSPVSGTIDFVGATNGHWVTSTFTQADLLGATASWAEFPIVVTGSKSDNFYMGATPFKRVYASGLATSVTSEVNQGYSDQTRRLADLDAAVLTTDQDDGVITAGTTEHAFSFSLDEVVLVPSPVNNIATASITRASEVKSAFFEPGSKKEVKAVLADAIDITGHANGDKFTITVPVAAGGDGIAYTVLLDTGTAVDANEEARTYGISRTSVSDDADLALTIVAAINGAASGKYKYGANNLGAVPVHKIQGITAKIGSTSSKITLTMDTAGTAGNVASILAATTGFEAALLKTTAFVGGEDSTSFSGIISAGSGSADSLRPLTEIIKGFHVPLAGGFDGTNIIEADPFNNRVIEGKTTSTSYAYASIERAVDLISDAEAVEHNLACMPGITNTSLTTKLVRACEARGDSLAIIDLPDVYVPPFQQSCTTFAERIKTSPEKAAAALVKRQLNSSYGATYYPWVKIRDEINSRDVWCPPSVVALGVMAYTEERDAVWFAPAGFNRGGLNKGNAGLPVLQVTEQLLSRDRDTLYSANINPIASFVSEGLVVFGQKTLQSTQSALDRINVRRLLIFIKKIVSNISNNLLFEQNVQATWTRFINLVVPKLQRIKTRFGLSDFKVVLDDTTTTPDLVDRNIMYAKIFLKPARSIEFIAVDFVITNSGAGFDESGI